ncbi:DUF6293 family protein [Methanolapillus millepedarum]|uniref:DUF6293 family protein n=1 Tax=Methanolapillus millepedarum TaxID=3028296 RepID=UPI003B848B75
MKAEDYLDCKKPREQRQYLTTGDFSKLRTEGVKDIIDIITFPVVLPEIRLITVLKKISLSENEKITKRDLINHMRINEENKKIFGYPGEITSEKKVNKDERARIYAWLNQNIINKLEKDWGLINIHKDGKNSWLSLTQKGRDMLKYLDMDFSCEIRN